MSFAVAAVVIGGTALGYQIYSGERAYKEQKQASEQAQRNAQAAATKADQDFNRANPRRPDIGAMLAANMGRAGGEQGGTMLTGPMGIDPNILMLGRSTLLGQ